MDVGDVGGLFGRSVEANLCGGGKVFEDLTPGRILGGATTVTLIDDDQIEKAGGELPEQLLPLFRAGDGLIQPQINFVRRVDAALVDGGGDVHATAVIAFDSFGSSAELGHSRTERAEVVNHRLVNQHIAVGQKQDALLLPGFPKPPNNLESCVGLPGTRSHYQ